MMPDFHQEGKAETSEWQPEQHGATACCAPGLCNATTHACRCSDGWQGEDCNTEKKGCCRAPGSLCGMGCMGWDGVLRWVGAAAHVGHGCVDTRGRSRSLPRWCGGSGLRGARARRVFTASGSALTRKAD